MFKRWLSKLTLKYMNVQSRSTVFPHSLASQKILKMIERPAKCEIRSVILCPPSFTGISANWSLLPVGNTTEAIRGLKIPVLYWRCSLISVRNDRFHCILKKNLKMAMSCQNKYDVQRVQLNTVEPLITDTAGEFKFCPL